MVIIPRMTEPGVHLLVASFNHVGIEARVTDISDSKTLEIGLNILMVMNVYLQELLLEILLKC